MISPEVSCYEEYNIKKEECVEYMEEYVEYLEDVKKELAINSKQIVFENDTAKCGEVMVGQDGDFTFICVLCKQPFHELRSFGSHIREFHLSRNATTIISVEKAPSWDSLCEKGSSISISPQREIKPEASRSASNIVQKELDTVILDTIASSDCNDNISSRVEVSNGEESTPVEISNDSTKVGEFVCKLCGRSYQALSSYRRHMRNRHPNGVPDQINCKYCYKEFQDLMQLETHTRTHTGKKRYVCPLCPKLFDSSQSRQFHINVHNGERPYKCPHCPRAFADSRTCERHKREHLEASNQSDSEPESSPPKNMPDPIRKGPEVIIVDTTVSTDCRENEDLTEDVSNCAETTTVAITSESSQVGEFGCPICGRSYQAMSSYRRHMRKRHPDGVPKQIICHYCYKEFDDMFQLEKHVRTHSGPKRYVCPSCPRTFVNNRMRQAHIYTHTEYKCAHCPKTFRHQINLWKHERLKKHSRHNEENSISSVSPQQEIKPESSSLESKIDNTASSDCKENEGLRDGGSSSEESVDEIISNCSEEEQFICGQCGLSYQRKDSLKRHMRKKHHNRKEDVSTCDDAEGKTTVVSPNEKEEINCELCERSYKTKEGYRAHVKKVHEEKKYDVDPTICIYCDKKFDDVAQLKTHVVTHTGRRRFVCPHCPKLFSDRKVRQYHVNTHTGERPFKCSLCPRAFAHPTNLESHIRAHLKIKKFSCRYCDKRFVQSFERVAHERIHTGERPFQCEECGRRFISRVKLTEHSKRHNNIKPYVCTVCDKAFYNSNLLKDHMPIHTNERPWHCNVCGKNYPRRKSLALHMKLHSSEKTYVCDICGEAFFQSTGLYTHRKSHGDKL